MSTALTTAARELLEHLGMMHGGRRAGQATLWRLMENVRAHLSRPQGEPCAHDWTPMYTDRDSPQSYAGGQGYRGYRVVGRKCRRCGENELNAAAPAPPAGNPNKKE